MKKSNELYLLLLLVMAACAAMGKTSIFDKLESTRGPALYRDREGRFNHAAHLEYGIECDYCHPTAEKAKEAGMPTDERGVPSVAMCSECHQGFDVEVDLDKFFVGKKIVWTNVTELPPEVVFSHESHHEKGVSCDRCHKGTNKSQEVTTDLRTEKDDCLNCHARYGTAENCGLCHRQINVDYRPENHFAGWERFHGAAARSGVEPPYTNRCSLCHSDSYCVSCHKDEEPRDHNSFWRQRGHGIAASMDRDRCATCHQSYSCDSCHKETTPASHRGSWGRPRYRHCLACHFPLEYQGCVTCHKEMKGHFDTPPMPSDLNHAAANEEGCRSCHGNPSKTHIDNGVDCRICHR